MVRSRCGALLTCTKWESSLQHWFYTFAAKENFAIRLHYISSLLPMPLCVSEPWALIMHLALAVNPSYPLAVSEVLKQGERGTVMRNTHTQMQSEADSSVCQWQVSLCCNGRDKCHPDLLNTNTHTLHLLFPLAPEQATIQGLFQDTVSSRTDCCLSSAWPVRFELISC